ncbi:MAG TPA: hypothetical protein VLQ46_11410 [Casimicrobiaceae bacterium]|nr:hypothetical protein [Casimicrobiaceae bacterium]
MTTLRRPVRRRAAITIEPPTLTQFVLLSMLLHVLVVVLIGNAPGTGARRGDGTWWGPLDVTLRQLVPELTQGPRAAPGVEERARAPALLRRPSLEPQPIEERAPEPETASPSAPMRVEPAPTELAPVEPLPRLDIEREIAPPLAIPPREVPVGPTAPIERLAPPKIEREAAPPVELPPREVPLVPETPIERIGPPPIERSVAPPVELPPREVPVVREAPVERIAPRSLERELAPPAPAISRPAASPTPEREAAPPRHAAPETTAPPVERPAGATTAPQSAPAATPARPQAAPAEERLRFGTPPAPPEEEIFKQRPDVVTPPSEPGGVQHIDRDAARERAREIASGRTGSRGVFNLPLPVPPEKKTKEAIAIEKAARPDCREAYSGMGLLAVPVLVANAITDSGCKW